MATRRDQEGRLRRAQRECRGLDRRGKGRMLDHWGKRKVTGYGCRRLMRKLVNVLPERTAGVRLPRAACGRGNPPSGNPSMP